MTVNWFNIPKNQALWHMEMPDVINTSLLEGY